MERESVIIYGQTIRWTSFDGSRQSVEVTGYDLYAVKEATERLAREAGWLPARWWQFWRWGDTRP